MRNRILVLVGVAVLLAFVLVFWQRARRSEGSRALTVGIATWPGFAPGFVAEEKGFFANLDVDFLILDDFTARQNAFTSGQTDATISTLDSWAFESGQGVDGTGILVLDESFGADGIVVKAGVESAEDLLGKRIAYTRGSPSHFFLIMYLKRAGMNLNDLVTVEVDDPGRAGEAFVSRSVDAAVTWEPNITQIVQSGEGAVLASTRTYPGLIVDILVASPDAMKEKKDALEALVKGWLQAVDYIKQNSAESYEIMAPRLSIPAADFPAMAEGLRYADSNRNHELLSSHPNSAAVKIFNEAVQVWKAENLIQQERSGVEMLTDEFVH